MSDATDHRDLTLTRDIAATPAALFRCWTDPALIPSSSATCFSLRSSA